jgi:hypothetical protein
LSQHILCRQPDVSDGHTTTIFRVQELGKQKMRTSRWHYNPEDHTPHSHHCENLRSYWPILGVSMEHLGWGKRMQIMYNYIIIWFHCGPRGMQDIDCTRKWQRAEVRTGRFLMPWNEDGDASFIYDHLNFSFQAYLCPSFQSW